MVHLCAAATSGTVGDRSISATYASMFERAFQVNPARPAAKERGQTLDSLMRMVPADDRSRALAKPLRKFAGGVEGTVTWPVRSSTFELLLFHADD